MSGITEFCRRALRASLPLLVAGLLVGPVRADLPDFTLPGLDGQSHSLSDYRGKWVLVNYWATWCPPCLEELPELEVFHSGAQGRAVVLGVNMETIGEPELRAFVEEQFLSFPILVASERPRRTELVGPVDGLPTSYLVAPSGEVVARQVGQITAEAINGFIEKYEQNENGGDK
jgi:peroxiredoxin